MLKKLNAIRYTYIQSHLYALLLTTITLLAVFLTIDSLFSPTWLGQMSILLYTISYFVIGLLYSLYVGFRSSSELKAKIDALSVMIMQLARGNYHSRIDHVDEGEMARIGTELNELAVKMEQQVRSLQRLADEKAAYAKEAHKAATIEERQRLARDLHDSVSQQLFALTMMSQAVIRLMETNPEKAKHQMTEIAETAMKAQTEMRALLLHLRPVHLSGETLTTGIEQLVQELQTKCAINFRLCIAQIDDLAEGTEEHLFRIIQESLSNTLRHAEADEVTVKLKQDKREVFLHLADNGQGFDLGTNGQKKASYGLKTMKERSEEIGGVFTIRTKEGEGTYIDIRVPYRRKDE